ncbi:MAG: cupredoxin domain-containing protein [Acidobacteriota bacterium]
MRLRIWIGLVVAGAAISAVAAGRPADSSPRGGPADVVLEMTARRFEFVPDRLVVTEGDRVTIVVRSEDTTHGIEIPRLGLAAEIPRGGRPTVLTFTAPQAGTYELKCSEYCGRGHDRMRGSLVVKPRPAEGERP